jgi:hypothetical protein
MVIELTQGEREELRMVVLAYLAQRNTAAFTAAQVAPILRRRRAVDFLFDDQAVESAMTFLDGQKWTEPIPSDFGASMPRKVTSAGVLEAERRGLC